LETFRKAIEMILESNELLSPEEEKAREAELKAKKMQLAVQEEIFLLNLKKWNFWWNNDLVFVAGDFSADTDSNVIIVSFGEILI